jgi:hypothetical protein
MLWAMNGSQFVTPDFGLLSFSNLKSLSRSVTLVRFIFREKLSIPSELKTQGLLGQFQVRKEGLKIIVFRV